MPETTEVRIYSSSGFPTFTMVYDIGDVEIQKSFKLSDNAGMRKEYYSIPGDKNVLFEFCGNARKEKIIKDALGL